MNNQLIDITGQKFGELTVLEYKGNRMWLCKCSCGNHKIVRKNDLTSGKVKTCGHNTRFNDLTGQTFGEWTVIEYAGDRKWRCRCSCGTERILSGYDLRKGKTKSCGHNTKTSKVKIGDVYGEWTVIDISDKPSHHKCRCSCGTIRDVSNSLLLKGESKSCGHNTNRFIDMTGQRFGEWTVLRFLGDYTWECQCSCGTIKPVNRYDLISGKSTNCGCKRNKNLTGRRFGKLTVTKYLGNSLWECRCDCGNDTKSITSNLLNGNKKSCGCLQQDKTNFILASIENALVTYIENKNELPFPEDIAKLLGITSSTVRKYRDTYGLKDYFNTYFGSTYERDIYNYMTELLGKDKVISRDRTILSGKELDIYIPELKLAIEFNGDYWHSDDKIDKKYHQNKTIACAKKGIRLIHIFEYEWKNENKQNKIKQFLFDVVKGKEVIYGRKTYIKVIGNSLANEFTEKYHLQGSRSASINLGCFDKNNRLLGIMTFGKPNFNQDYEYEIYRLCWINGITVVGGAEKLFKYFIKKYNPSSIITYSDISKFTGNIYLRLGFNPIKPNVITEPNYIWKNETSDKTLSRYQTQKHKLVKQGLGNKNQTEEEIMMSLGYIKIYDCGNIRLEWIKEHTP